MVWNSTWKARHVRAFTLIEILTVIAIIGILATILLPSVGSAISKARRMKDANSLRQIAMAYISCMNDSPDRRELAQCKSLYDFANMLAKHGYLTTPEVYFSDSDPMVSLSQSNTPKSIGRLIGGQWQPSGEFGKFPLSFVVIVNISMDAPASTTPIAYSRGLDVKTGLWGRDGVYSNGGGFIVFLDGHVQFFDNISALENQLANFYTGKRTAKITDAVNSGARALSHGGVDWEAK